MLADLGAQVVKIDLPEGGFIWIQLPRKRALTLRVAIDESLILVGTRLA